MIRVEHRGGVAVLHIEHGKANAIDIEFCEQLTTELRRQTDGAVVLTGRGSIFSAGVDLLRVLDGGADYVRRFLPILGKFCETVFGFPQPLVTAINGHAIAGGCVLACMADWRIMALDGGQIGVPELRVGVPYPVAALEVMRFAVPRRYFSDVVYGGDSYDPAAALTRGLVDEVVEPDDLLDRAAAAAKRMATRVPESFQLTKAQVRSPTLQRMRSGATHDAKVLDIWMSDATLAAIRTYVSRTFKRR